VADVACSWRAWSLAPRAMASMARVSWATDSLVSWALREVSWAPVATFWTARVTCWTAALVWLAALPRWLEVA
jgi:hypothetical protein